MKVVQALSWLRDTLPRDKQQILRRLRAVLHDPKHGKSIRDDLQVGLPTLPAWMQGFVREMLQPPAEVAKPVPDDNSRHASL